MSPKSYIVVGAGWFGMRAVQTLEKFCPDASITVLELGSKDYMDINMQTPRMMSDPKFAERVYAPLSMAWKRAELVNVKDVKAVSAGRVDVVDDEGNGKVLEAEGVVLATGARHASPLIKDVAGLSRDERIGQLKAWNDTVKKSKGVLVVGGGSTGVELAGDLKHDFPNLEVTLVNKPEMLMRGCKSQAKMHALVLKQLRNLGVEVITGDYIEGLAEDYVGELKKYQTVKGVEIQVDIVVMCVGATPNVPYAPEDALDAKSGGLLVDNALLCTKMKGGVDPSKPVWALGDCTQYTGRGIFADPQIAAFTASVRHYHKTASTKGGPQKYRHKPDNKWDTLVSVGRNGGAATVPFVNRKLGVVVKGSDVALKLMYKKELGVKV